MKAQVLIRNAAAMALPLAVCAGLAGCASHGTLTQGTLYMDARNAVIAADQSAAPDCGSRHIVSTEVVTPPDVVVNPVPGSVEPAIPQQPVSLPRGNVVDPAERGFSKSVERWTVERCGKQARYLVTFDPGDSGRPSISVKPEG